MGTQEVTLNVDPSVGHFQNAVFSSIGVMRNTLRSLDDGSFLRNYAVPGYEGVTHKFEIRDLDAVRGDATRTAYCSVIRALIDLLDRLVGIDEAVRMVNAQEHEFQAGQIIDVSVSEFVVRQVERISQDRNLTVPRKINRICGDTEQGAHIGRVLTSYVFARNAIEHHKCRPASTIELELYSFELFVGDAPMVFGEIIEAGGEVSGRMVERMRTLDRGEVISFSEQDVCELVFGLVTRLVPGMVKALTEHGNSRAGTESTRP